MVVSHSKVIKRNGKNKGNSIRIGKRIPESSVGLGYIHSEEINTDSNIMILDKTSSIIENKKIDVKREHRRVQLSEDGVLIESNGEIVSPAGGFAITSVFNGESPLFYLHRSDFLYVLDNEKVISHSMNYSGEKKELFVSELRDSEMDILEYRGIKIEVLKNNSNLDLSEKVKIMMHRVKDNKYSLYVYTNFDGSGDTYSLKTFNDNTFKSEILYLMKAFNEIEKNPGINEYSIENKESSPRIKVGSESIISTNQSRPPTEFEYRIKMRAKTRFSISNPGSVAIGMLYVNESSPINEQLSSVLSRLDKGEFLPKYLEMYNPHPKFLSMTKEDFNYWEIPNNIPSEKWLDYDIVVVSGYGKINRESDIQNINDYIMNGGSIIFDNGGIGGDTLSLQNLPILNTSFSSTNNTSLKYREDEYEGVERLYSITKNPKVGYNTNKQIVSTEVITGLSDTKKIISYSSSKQAIIQTKINDSIIIFSGVGLFRGLHLNSPENEKLVVNLILYMSETLLFKTEWKKDFVFHKSALFLEEYNRNNKTYYYNSLSEDGTGTVVAKKRILPSIRKEMEKYLPIYYKNSTGHFEVNVKSNHSVNIQNQNFMNGSSQTEWTQSKENAIPGWNTVKINSANTKFVHLPATGSSYEKMIGIISSEVSESEWTSLNYLDSGEYELLLNSYVSLESAMHISIYSGNNLISEKTIGPSSSQEISWSIQRLLFRADKPGNYLVRIRLKGKSYYLKNIKIEPKPFVYMNKNTNKDEELFAYTTKQNSNNLNLNEKERNQYSIEYIYPEIKGRILIRPYTYRWDNESGEYIVKYGSHNIEDFSISRSDGSLFIKRVVEVLPEIGEGPEWYDKNSIQYEFILMENNLPINMTIYNSLSGKNYQNQYGIVSISHQEIFVEQQFDNIRIEVETPHYEVIASQNKYSIVSEPEKRIEILPMKQNDATKGWFPRIKNGSFKKSSINLIEAINQSEEKYLSMKDRLFGPMEYGLPEMTRQMLIAGGTNKFVFREKAKYLTDNSLRLENEDIIGRTMESIQNERLENKDGLMKTFYFNNPMILNSKPINIYRVSGDDKVELFDGYSIDFDAGRIHFESTQSGQIFANYTYETLKVEKVTYNRESKYQELIAYSKRIFKAEHGNLSESPAPIVYFRKWNGQVDEVPESLYFIDYESGVVEFKEEIEDIVVMSYQYNERTNIPVKSIDRKNGILFFDSVDFRSEYRVSYLYKDNVYEYQGYYDEERNSFISLDLNITPGHTYIDNGQSISGDYYDIKVIPKLVERQSSLLSGEKIYLYIVPYKINGIVQTGNALRHTIGKEDWVEIKKSNPTAELLAIYEVSQVQRVEDVVFMDGRVRGGGLKENAPESIEKELSSKTNRTWDIGSWAGKRYFENGIVVITLPKEILVQHGGDFTESKVNESLNKFKAVGIYYKIIYK